MAFAQDKAEIVITSGHISNVMCINFSPNNRFIVTGSMDNTVRIWDRSLRQEYRVLYGHTGTIWNAVYTSDSKHILSIDDKGTFITWNHATGEIVQRMKIPAFVRQFAYVPNTSQVLIPLNGKITAFDIFTGKQVTTYGNFTDVNIKLTADGKYIITRAIEKINALRIIDYKKNETVGELVAEHESPPTMTGVSPDGKRVAAYSITNKIVTIWDVDSRKIVSTFQLKENKNIKEIIFTPDSKHVLLMESMGGQLDVYRVKNGKYLRSMNEKDNQSVEQMRQGGAYSVGSAWDVAISPDNTMLGIAITLTESKGKGQMPENFMGGLLFDYKRNKELGRLKGYYKMSTHLSVGSNGKYLINSNYNKHPGLRVWNMREGELERFIPTSGTAGASADGSVFGAWVIDKTKEKPVLTVYNARNIKPIFQTQEVNALSDVEFSADGRFMLTQEVNVNLQDPKKNKYFFRLWDVQKKKALDEVVFLSNEMPIFNGLRLSPDGKHIIAQINSSQVTSWEIESGKRVATVKSQVGYDFLLDFVPNSTQILISHSDPTYSLEKQVMESPAEWMAWDYTTGEKSAAFQSGRDGILFSGDFSPDGKYLAIGEGGYFNDIHFNVVIWDWAAKKVVCTLEGHHGAVRHVWFGPDAERIYSTAEDGFINVWEAEECALTASMIAQKEIDYIIISPDNYYKASKGNNQGITFRYQGNLYTFDQFDMRFNRPDKVLTDLGVSRYAVRLYKKAWEKRLRKMGFAPEDLEGELALPKIELVGKNDLPITTENEKIELKLKAWDDTYELDRVAVYINDVPVPELQGIPIDKKTQSIELPLDIDLSQGNNLVKVSVFNKKGLESLRESFQINYAPPQSKKPHLHIFTIGVSKFKEEESNLKFATKDATDLVNKFKASNYFGKVHTYKLFDEEATKENVSKIAKQLEKANTNDQIIVYVSSHGLLDENLDYYLAMYDVDFENPTARGLPYDVINNMLDGIACRNRLVMIDACHSGEVDKEQAVERSSLVNNNVNVNTKSGTEFIRPKAGLKNSFTYMKALFSDVSKGTGATVISAAGGFEFALESDDWNNGVFTYAVLHGLTDGNADMNGDGYVDVTELKQYVTIKVVDLTNGQQHPTTRTENEVNKFVLFKTSK